MPVESCKARTPSSSRFTGSVAGLAGSISGRTAFSTTQRAMNAQSIRPRSKREIPRARTLRTS
eukprot:1754198-Prymnesium_polylepis.1